MQFKCIIYSICGKIHGILWSHHVIPFFIILIRVLETIYVKESLNCIRLSNQKCVKYIKDRRRFWLIWKSSIALKKWPVECLIHDDNMRYGVYNTHLSPLIVEYTIKYSSLNQFTWNYGNWLNEKKNRIMMCPHA